MNVKILTIAAAAGLLIGSSATLAARQVAAPGQQVHSGAAGMLAQLRDRDDSDRDRDRFRRERELRRDRDRDEGTFGRGDRDERFERYRERFQRERNRDRDER